MANSIVITPVEAGRSNLILGYGNGGFRFSADRTYQGSVLIYADQIAQWQPPTGETISAGDLSPLIERAADIDILVLGCGETFSAPPGPLRGALKEQGIVLEWMDTGAACRTFNVLLSEDRRAAAALIAID